MTEFHLKKLTIKIKIKASLVREKEGVGLQAVSDRSPDLCCMGSRAPELHLTAVQFPEQQRMPIIS